MNTLDEQDVEDWLFAKHEAETDVPGGGANEVSNSMLSLPVVAIANLASPAELFRCEFYKTTLSAASCIARQGVRRTFRGGTAQGKQYSKEFVPKIYEYCASGKCMQGADVKVALADYKPPASAHEKLKERNRALGAENVKGIEERIAAKEALPVAEDLERAAAAEAQNKSWRQFREEKDRQRAAMTPPVKPEREPHPLSRRGLTESREDDVEEKTCSTPGCGTPLGSRNRSGLCEPHQKAAYMKKYFQDRKKNGAPANDAPPEKKPRRHLKKPIGRRARPAQRAANGASPASQSAPDDVEEILEERRAHHLAEAERCDRALKALRA